MLFKICHISTFHSKYAMKKYSDQDMQCKSYEQNISMFLILELSLICWREGDSVSVLILLTAI